MILNQKKNEKNNAYIINDNVLNIIEKMDNGAACFCCNPPKKIGYNIKLPNRNVIVLFDSQQNIVTDPNYNPDKNITVQDSYHNCELDMVHVNSALDVLMNNFNEYKRCGFFSIALNIYKHYNVIGDVTDHDRITAHNTEGKNFFRIPISYGINACTYLDIDVNIFEFPTDKGNLGYTIITGNHLGKITNTRVIEYDSSEYNDMLNDAMMKLLSKFSDREKKILLVSICQEMYFPDNEQIEIIY